MRQWVIGITLAMLGACTNNNQSQVTLDVTEMLRHSALVGVDVGAIELVVLSDGLPIEVLHQGVPKRVVPVSVSQSVVSLVLDAGPRRLFTVTAFNQESPAAPVYYGEHLVDLPARSEIDILLEVSAAGGVAGTLSTSDNAALAPNMLVTFTNTDPQQPAVYHTRQTTALLQRALPVGNYRVDAKFFTNGLAYTLPAETRLTITQGQIEQTELVLFPAGAADFGVLARTALKNGNIRDAKNKYTLATLSHPSNLQAHFGAALTQTLLLPESQAITDLLQECGEPGFNVQTALFGTDGAVTHFRDSRTGTATHNTILNNTAQGLKVTRTDNTTPQGATTITIATANTIFATLSSYTPPAAAPPPLPTIQQVRMEFDDLSMGTGVGTKLDLSFEFDIPSSSTAPFVLDVNSTSSFFNPKLSLSHPSFDPSSYTEPISGSVEVTQLGTQVGQPVQVKLINLTWKRYEDNPAGTGSPPVLKETIVLNGVITDTLDAEYTPPATAVPFAGISYVPPGTTFTEPEIDTFIQIIQKCSDWNTARLRIVLAGIKGDVAKILNHLDAIATSTTADQFLWVVPIDLLGNNVAIPLGITSVHLWRSVFYAASALGEFLEQYDILNAPFASLIGTIDTYYPKDKKFCGAPECPVSYARTDFMPSMLEADLNLHFLKPALQSGISNSSMALVRSHLITAMDALIAAAGARPAGNRLFDLSSGRAQSMAQSIRDAATDLKMGLLGAQPLTTTTEYQWELFSFFDNPPTFASIKAAFVAGDTFFTVTPTDTNSQTNATIDPTPALDGELFEKLLVFTGVEPSTPITCTTDTTCQGKPYWVCNMSQSQCESRAPEPGFLSPSIRDGFDATPPAFINLNVWKVLD